MLLSQIHPYIRYARYLNLDEKTSFGEVIAPDARFFHTVSGCGKIKVAGEEYEMTPTATLVVRAGMPYRIETPDAAVKYIVFNFDFTQNARAHSLPIIPKPASEFKREMILDPQDFEDADVLSGVLYVRRMDAIQKYLLEILSEQTEKLLYYEEKSGYILARCIAECLRQKQIGMSNKERDTFARILSYVHEHFHEDLSNLFIAKKFSYHPNYVSLAIKRMTGVSLHQYVIHLRLLRSAELLENTGLPLFEIASKCGFCDQAYFSQCFKKHFSVSPSAYRERGTHA